MKSMMLSAKTGQIKFNESDFGLAAAAADWTSSISSSSWIWCWEMPTPYRNGNSSLLQCVVYEWVLNAYNSRGFSKRPKTYKTRGLRRLKTSTKFNLYDNIYKDFAHNLNVVCLGAGSIYPKLKTETFLKQVFIHETTQQADYNCRQAGR